MITVKYGSKKFEVKKDKIYTPDGITISESLSVEEVEVKGNKPTLNIKGIGLQSVSMSVDLDCRFVNVETELRYWKNTLLGKKSAILMVGSYQVGKMLLTSYKVSEIRIAKNGKYVRAHLELSFTEDASATNSNKKNVTTTQKVAEVKKSTSTAVVTKKIRIGSIIKPKSGVRWYETAQGALNRTGKSGNAYQEKLRVTYIYHNYNNKDKVMCVNPRGLGWLRVDDVDVITY